MRSAFELAFHMFPLTTQVLTLLPELLVISKLNLT